MSDRTVFVGNLSWDTRWQGLKDHMRQAGSVLHAEVFTESSGRSAGCGIVEFETREEAIHSIQTMNDSVLDGRQVFVREDRDQGRRAGGGGGGGGGGGFGDRGGGFNDRGGGFNDRGGGFNDRGGGFNDRGGGFGDRGGGFNDRGGGFNDRGGGFNDRGGGFGGAGFNDRGGGFGGAGFGDGFGGNNGGFQDRGGFDQGGGFQDRGFDRDKGFGGDFGGRGDFGGDSGGRGGFRSDRGRKVVVSNLPYHTRWQELKDIFRSCGDVIRADVMMGSDGRSKGMGTILFEKEDDANTAVSRLNGAELDGRVIEVRLDKF